MRTNFHVSDLFKTAWHAYKENMGAALLVAIGLLAIELVTYILHSTIVGFAGPALLGAIFAFAIHQTILFGANVSWRDAIYGKSFNRFFWRSMIFFGVISVVIALITLIALVLVGKEYSTGVRIAWFVILQAVVGMPLIGVSFALWGTMLPATITGKDATLRAAWQRAKGWFWYTFVRLAVGPFLVGIIVLLGAWLITNKLVPMHVIIENGMPDLGGISVYIIVQMANLFVTALTATVLCKTYLHSQNEAPTSAP